MHVEPKREHRVAERLDGVFFFAVGGERSGKRRFRLRASQRVGLEPEQIPGEVQKLLELEQSLELSAQQILLDHGLRLRAPTQGPASVSRWPTIARLTRALPHYFHLKNRDRWPAARHTDRFPHEALAARLARPSPP